MDRAIFPIKRTKSATKRTSGPVEVRETRGRALHSFSRDIVDLRLCRTRADRTYINTDNRIRLASGRTLSKATLFWVLHCGGWTAFGTFVWALNIADIGAFPSAVEYLLWVACGLTLTLGFRRVFRRGCSAGWSYTSLIVLAAMLSVLGGPIWYVVDLALLRAMSRGPGAMLGFGAMFAREAPRGGARSVVASYRSLDVVHQPAVGVVFIVLRHQGHAGLGELNARARSAR